MAAELAVYECRCSACQAGEHPDWDDHRHLNLLLSRLDEQQRRWVAAREAVRLGHGGFQRIAEITGRNRSRGQLLENKGLRGA